MWRGVVEGAVWFAKVSASETPMAAVLPPVAAPDAAVAADAVSSAFASSEPPRVSVVVLVPIVARDVTLLNTIAIEGTMAIGPAAPVRDSVVRACLPFA